MNPLRLHARNYRCFDQLDLDLPDGCVAILGDNGAGKSTIIDAIDRAIFGARSLADQLADTTPDDELLLELELEHAGNRYRIRRTYSARGRGKATLDFEVSEWYDAGEHVDWRSLTRASAKETQELIEATLGLSRETFRASAFLAQGDGAAFTDAQPRDRKRILAQVLGLDRYDQLQESARTDRRTIEGTLERLDGRTQAARELVEQKPDLARQQDAATTAETEAADLVADLEREHAGLAERYQQAREQAARRQAAEAELREAQTGLEQLEARARQADEAARAITAASLELDTLPAAADAATVEQREAVLAAAVEEHARLVSERQAAVVANRNATNEQNALIGRARELEANAERIGAEIGAAESGELDHCPTCAQLLGAEARATTIDTLTKRAVAIIDEVAGLRRQADAITIPPVPGEPPAAPVGELEQVRGQLRSIRDAATRRALLEERIRQNETAAAAGPPPDALTAARDTVAAKAAAVDALTPADLDGITAQGQQVKQRLETARASLEQQRTLKARLAERLTQISEAEALLEQAAAERASLQAEAELAATLERAFGRDGIPALIVENSAIPYLEAEANRILDLLGTSFRVELRTQAELKSGDGVRDTLDVIVTTENGERAYETFSGGERTRINLGLRIALARLLAHRRGAESRLLAIDEPDGLDEAGMAALVDVLRGLQADFDKLYIVSHVPALRDSFDTTLQVVRDGVWSRVCGAGMFEEATA